MSAINYLSRRVGKVLRRRRQTRHYRLLKVGGTLLALLSLIAEVRAQSALDGFDVKVSGAVYVVVVQPDGKILIGGSFQGVSVNGGVLIPRNRIARLNPDGTLDTSFDPNANGSVLAIAVQPDGKILVGGYFNESNGSNTIGGAKRNFIARLDPTGLADSFDPNANNIVLSIAVQADGKILAGGEFSGPNSIGGQTRNNIARLETNTGMADSFDPNANGWVNAVVVQPDGKILASGWFAGANSIGGQSRNRIARLDAKTGLADSFNPDADDIVHRLALQADGKVLAGGYFTSIGGQPRNRFARLDGTTGLADSLDPSPNNELDAISVQADGKILLGGYFTNIHNYVARLDTNTGLPDSFYPTRNAAVFAIAVQADGKILVGGGLDNDGYAHLARVERDGRLDQTLDAQVIGVTGDYVTTTATQPDGKIIIGGIFTNVLGVPRNNIARLNTDGTLDEAFDPNANNGLYVLAIQPDGKILVGGAFTSIGGQPRIWFGRLNADGTADTFNPGADGLVNSFSIQADGKILVGGQFNNIGGQGRNFIARLDPATLEADSFDAHPDYIIRHITVQPDGKILVAGYFHQIGGQSRTNIARLDPVTGLADSFDPNPTSPFPTSAVVTLALQPDGTIIAGGNFDTIGGAKRNFLARLDPKTGMADSFDPNPDDIPLSVVTQADGKILVGGQFSSIGGQSRNSIARLDPITALADSFDPNQNGLVWSIGIQSDGKILIGGIIDNVGGQSRNGFARLSNDTAALQNLFVGRTSVIWLCGGSTPQFTRVSFESSDDNVTYTSLGEGTLSGNSWLLSGLDLSTTQNFYIRARGYHSSAYYSAAQNITEALRYGPASSVTQTPTPFPTPTPASPTPTGTPATPTPAPTPTAFAPVMGNISTRLLVQTGDNAMIGGFIITGAQPKPVIVRGIGPSLPVAGALADPTIEVHGTSGELLASNDNWLDDPNQNHVFDTGLAPTNNLESALWGIIGSGSYTVIVRGKENASGVGLFEVYDLDVSTDSKLANVSTRGLVETADNVLIAGTIIMGNSPARVLVRGIGPSLTSFGVPNALQDPALELHDGNGNLIAVNDNWRSDQQAEIIATGIPPTNDLESAILRDLAPGNYTAIVSGVNGDTGVALVEAYQLN